MTDEYGFGCKITTPPRHHHRWHDLMVLLHHVFAGLFG